MRISPVLTVLAMSSCTFDYAALNGKATVSEAGASSGTGGAIATEAGTIPDTPSSTGGRGGSGGITTLDGSIGAGGIVVTGGALGSGGAIGKDAATTPDVPMSSGGRIGADGAVASGGRVGSGGVVATGGSPGVGGVIATGGSTGSGGMVVTGGSKGTGGAGQGGAPGSGGTATGSGGMNSSGGTPGTGGLIGQGGAGGAGTGGTTTVICPTTMPSSGNTYTGTNVNGTADGLNYGIWSNGSTGGGITVFSNARAFAASWNNSADFIAHLGLDFNGSSSYTAYGTITAQFAESKTGTAGGFSSIGMYGWMHSPCVEWYINEDSFNGLTTRGSITATIDGATYYLTTSTTTGTGGANACEAGHTGSWTNITSTRKTAHQCGTITVSDHFAAWAAQGWSLGNLASVHINVEVGGGTGSIQFPVADVTTTSK